MRMLEGGTLTGLSQQQLTGFAETSHQSRRWVLDYDADFQLHALTGQ